MTNARPVKDMKDRELFLFRADTAKAEADAASLDNVRDRCLRAEAAWREMADRADRTEKMRAATIANKAAALADAQEA